MDVIAVHLIKLHGVVGHRFVAMNDHCSVSYSTLSIAGQHHLFPVFSFSNK